MGGLTLVLIPISCITFLDADDIVRMVYARGSFDQAAVSSTTLALAWYAPMFAFWKGFSPWVQVICPRQQNSRTSACTSIPAITDIIRKVIPLGIFLGILGAVLSPVLVPLFAPGFSGGQRTLKRELLFFICFAVLWYSRQSLCFFQRVGKFLKSNTITQTAEEYH